MADMIYKRPDSLEDALDFLAQNGARTEILAGGTDVMVDLRAGELGHKKYLLDISRLKEINKIEFGKNELNVGAGVTLTRINQSDLILQHAPALVKCSETFAGRQVRNKATIGGNIAHSSPCGDTIPPLVIHDARALVATKNDRRLVPVETIASGPYQSSLPPDAVIVKFVLAPRRSDLADFQKIGRRKELAISRMSLAVMADKDDTGRISFVRIGLGACTPTPHRMDAVEDFLTGKIPTLRVLREAGKRLSEKMIDITGRRSSIVYKEPAVQGLLMRILYPMVQS